MTEPMNEPIPAPAAAALADARAKLQQLGGCALLIGVEAYAGLPAEKQLHAGRNDVLSYWKVCRRLGYRPEHIRVLTSPVLGVDDIVRAEQDLGPELHPERSKDEIRARVEGWFAGSVPVVLGDASRDEIVKGVEWLASKLVFRVKVDWEGWKLDQELAGLPGLLAYSGHGAHLQGDLALCPSDVGRGLERAVSFAELRALIDAGDDVRASGTPHPADNLTVVLDCCFAAAGTESRALRVPTLTPTGSGPAPSPKHEIGSRVFCASGRDEHAYQGILGGRWHGAFTWAFTRALEQWKTAPSGQFRKSTVSHVELLFRIRMLLEALSFDQHPVLVDRIGNLPVFQHDADVERETSAGPDMKRMLGQIDPADGFAYYEISDASTGKRLAQIIAASVADDANGSRMKGGWEYWRIFDGDLRASKLNTSEYGDLIVRKVQSGHWSTAPETLFTVADADFACPVGEVWESYAGSATYHKETEGFTRGGFVVDVARAADGSWSGTMEFYRDTGGGLLFASMPDASERRLQRRSDYKPIQKCSITDFAPILSVVSGHSYVLFDMAKNVGIHKAHWTDGAYYATSDQDGGNQPQTLELVSVKPSGSTLICSGDEVYIRSIEADLSSWYLLPGGGENDLWYENAVPPRQVHRWIIRNFPGDEKSDGKGLLLGDLVTFESKAQSECYMGANEGDGYLRTTGLVRVWRISAS